MKFFYFLVCLFWALGASAQQFMMDVKGEAIREKSYTEIVGSPYLFSKDWLKSFIITYQNQKYENLECRFDSYSQGLEYKKGEQIILIKEGSVKEFELEENGKKHLFQRFLIDSKPFFCEILYNGKYKFLLRHQTLLREQKLYNSATTEKIFEIDKSYFLFFDNKAIKIKLNKKSILEALPQEKSRIEEFMEKKSSKLKSEQEIIDLFGFLEN